LRPAYFIPPEAGFLKTLAGELAARHGRELARVTVILPTRRAALYLRYYLYHNLRGPFLSPRIYAFSDLVNELAVRLDPRPVIPPAERAWWLYAIVRDFPVFSRTAESFDRFLPWGLRLSEVLEEFEKEMVPVKDLLYPPEDLPQEARNLLAHLSEVATRYRKLLREKGFTTPAERLRLLAERIEECFSPDGPCYLCGFAALSRAEAEVFRAFISAGAEVFFEGRPEDIPDFLEETLSRLGLDPVPFKKFPVRRPRITFRVAADVHQECRAAAALLPKKILTPDEVLILLPVAGHLLPLLYSLPESLPVNITLGYPVKRSLPASFLLLLMELHEKRLGERYPVMTYLALLKHPYIRGSFVALKAREKSLEALLREHGSPYLSLFEIEELAGGDQALEDFHRRFIRPLAEVNTPRRFAEVLFEILERVVAPRRERLREARDNQDILARHFLYALESEILPLFAASSFADEPLKPETLFRLFRELLSGLKAPFEGDPLCGLQVMGLLETRLLSFRKVIVLDANEGSLPSPEEINPLLPEGVRPALSLPPRSRQEALERYHFRRLIAAAREVDIFYLSVMETSARRPPQVRSRYVEALLWEEERRRKRLFTENDELLKHLPLFLKPRSPETAIPRGRAEREEIERILFKREISATFLETYLECPARFYFRYLLELKPPARITDYDAAELGTVIHAVLERYFKPFEGRRYEPRRDNDPERLLALFREEFERSVLSRRLGPERKFFITRTAEFRLKRYLEALREIPAFRIVSLERSVRREHPSLGLKFYGRLDRVDEFESGLVILDYKTGGSVRSLSLKRLRELLEEDFSAPPTLEGLSALRKRMPDLQLLLYLFLMEEAQDAAYVQLASGKDGKLFKSLLYRAPFNTRDRGRDRGLSEEDLLRLREEVFPRLLTLLIEHMLSAEAFFIPEKPPGCRFCDYFYACPGRKPV